MTRPGTHPASQCHPRGPGKRHGQAHSVHTIGIEFFGEINEIAFGFAHLGAIKMTMPWLRSEVKGSVNETYPKSNNTLVMNRA